jgi:hypothetical protein
MALAQALRNDQVERGADSLALGEPEDADGTGIPEADDAVAVRRQNGVRRCSEDCPASWVMKS